MKQIKRNEIESALLKQAKSAGMTEKFYTALIDDYMTMWDTEQKLKEDIEERGVKVTAVMANGSTNVKKNDSVDQYTKVNMQMLKLLQQLRIEPSGKEGGNPWEKIK